MVESTAGITVRLVEPEVVPEMAEMVVEPVATVVASPFVPVLLPMLATLCTVELQLAELVRSSVPPSE
jgi:hypothetical protein